jgi:hypothetical protein
MDSTVSKLLLCGIAQSIVTRDEPIRTGSNCNLERRV